MDRPEAPAVDLYAVRSTDEPAGTIGMPVRDHMNTATVTSLVTSALGPGWVEPGRHVDLCITQGSILTIQRNELVQRMRGDWLLFIDDDMVWQPDQIRQLVETRDRLDLDILGGLCFRRSSPYQPTLYMRESPTSGAYNFLEDWEPDTALEVDATGMAFVVVHKRVFEAMVRHFEGDPEWVFPPYDVRIQQSAPEFFRWEGKIGEDLRFCQMAKEAGCRIFVDTGIEIGHVTEVQVRHRDYLREIAGRSPELEELRRDLNDSMGLPTMSAGVAQAKLGGLS